MIDVDANCPEGEIITAELGTIGLSGGQNLSCATSSIIYGCDLTSQITVSEITYLITSMGTSTGMY